MHEFFARCAQGFESFLSDELRSLHARRVRPLSGGAAFFGTLEDAYRVCLWSRIATRVQLVLDRVQADDATNLYESVYAFSWNEHIGPEATISIRAHGTTAKLRNTQFTALKVKDALCDCLRDNRGTRPNVDSKNPDVSIDVALHKGKATLFLNLSGTSLHKRAYRKDGQQTKAPLKETLAAGILHIAGWPGFVQESLKAQGGSSVGFVDPMCGSGTLAIEAALIACGIAPGLSRNRWGFMGWAQHNESLWKKVLNEAKQRAEEGMQNTSSCMRILAGDIDDAALSIAQGNARRAGVDSCIEFYQADASELARYIASTGKKFPVRGLLAVNPPYGKRMVLKDNLGASYASLSAALDSLDSGWRVAAITPDVSIDTALGMVADRVVPCFNGPIETAVRVWDYIDQRTVLDLDSLTGSRVHVPVAETASEQFAMRLRKVAKDRAKWARKEKIECYRIYDADLPDYAFAIDMLQGAGPNAGERFAHIAEYQAPSSIDPQRAARRLADACAIIPAVLAIDPNNVVVKVRTHSKGGSQYYHQQSESRVVYVEEAGCVFELDLTSHLDTGLFLDHRNTRQRLRTLASSKSFLNLFAYTGSATVQAAAGGASRTTTVDMSQVYLDWARRNMYLNGFDGPEHTFVCGDVLSWLETHAQTGISYEVIFCDPPTFSNSKRMGKRTFDVQRDHIALLQAAAKILVPNGTLVFSCNLRSFKLDEQALTQVGLYAQDISAKTIPYDFARTPKIHRCFLVRHLLPE